MTPFDSFYEVAVPRPMRFEFTYGYSSGSLTPGTLVRVPFGKTKILGVVTKKTSEVSPDWVDRLKPISEVVSPVAVLSPKLLELTHWLGEYYLSSWGEAIFNALPAFPKKFPELTALDSCVVKGIFQKTLTAEQDQAIQFIWDKRCEKKPFLLQGVTGSGKTEVYLRLAQKVLDEGKSVIFLVPEISLINQIRLFVEEAFPGQIAYFHSKQTSKERLLNWQALKRGQKRIVVGPRSALFAPLENLGLIILDEEHDDSYKQDETPRYHALKTARRRAQLEDAILIAGSATPSLDTLELVREGIMHRVKLATRISFEGKRIIKLVDMRRDKKTHSAIVSDPLTQKIGECLAKKEGVLIFLNRRGHSTQVRCNACGYFYTCPHCDIALTYHQEASRLICHYCRYALKPAFKCPQCGENITYSGFGTEKVESELAKLFPQARIERLDSETVAQRGNLDEVLTKFRNQEIDILVGTQMIAKGLDFKHLTLVGIISAEGNLQLPDFRASERTFQVLEQVSGRSGRSELGGDVLIQTYVPDHYSIRAVSFQDSASYVEKELEHRREFDYPPFVEMISLRVRGRTEKIVIDSIEALKKDLDKVSEGETEKFEILGPAPLPFYRLRGYYRWHLMIKGKDLSGFKKTLTRYLAESKRSPLIYLEIDVDPIQIL